MSFFTHSHMVKNVTSIYLYKYQYVSNTVIVISVNHSL